MLSTRSHFFCPKKTIKAPKKRILGISIPKSSTASIKKQHETQIRTAILCPRLPSAVRVSIPAGCISFFDEDFFKRVIERKKRRRAINPIKTVKTRGTKAGDKYVDLI
jgi:hypothetical protein